MQTADIRQRWLDFFAERGHAVVPSASLVSDDPTLLFTVAGMVPFVPYLTGLVPSPYPRATSVQKCIRTNDIEEVGKTPRHGTFFQMSGNFSFGDYFKEGAISMAWELLTTPEADGGYGFEPSDLWVTVYEDDDEAIELWKRIAGLPEERIQRLGKDTNYWHTGQPGPAGPCSEIFFDRGPEYGIDGGPATDDDRYVEIWNLVFMQYLIDDVKSKTDFRIVKDLPKKNIDTGMGLERVAFIKQGVDNMYEIDQVRPVLDRAAELSGRTYGANHDDDVRMRVIADHVRSALMLMSDGVSPSNEGRGYILRRLLRRSIRAMRLLGVEGPTFRELFAASRDAMKAAYPEVASDYAHIEQLALGEEETFLRTLVAGTSILDGAVAETKQSGRERARRRHRVPAARHLRVPDRDHPRDGRRGRSLGRSRRVRHPHDRTAHPREGRREVEEEGARRPLGVRRLPRQGRDDLHGLHRPRDRVERARHPRRRRTGEPCESPGRPPRSSSPRRRSTRSPAGRRPTRAASSATGSSSRCSTCRSP